MAYFWLLVRVYRVRLRLETAAANGPIVHPQMIYDSGDPRWNDIDTGKLKNVGKKPVPVSLCPPEIPHGLTWERSWASTVTAQRLIA
jgi:hypothetical protein